MNRNIDDEICLSDVWVLDHQSKSWLRDKSNPNFTLPRQNFIRRSSSTPVPVRKFSEKSVSRNIQDILDTKDLSLPKTSRFLIGNYSRNIITYLIWRACSSDWLTPKLWVPSALESILWGAYFSIRCIIFRYYPEIHFYTHFWNPNSRKNSSTQKFHFRRPIFINYYTLK